LLQVAYHARMAEEQGAFAFADVADAITAKMIRRHPHVFGSEAERAAGAAPGFWERLKAKEKTANPAVPQSVLADVPAGMPALTRAIKLQNKAAKVGFDWPSLAPVLDKLKEELAELEEAISAQNGRDQGKAVDPEAALRAANEKFTRRFHAIERALASDGRTPAQSTLAEMDRLWDEAKAAELETDEP
jgi:ATP diphosphatase